MINHNNNNNTITQYFIEVAINSIKTYYKYFRNNLKHKNNVIKNILHYLF